METTGESTRENQPTRNGRTFGGSFGGAFTGRRRRRVAAAAVVACAALAPVVLRAGDGPAPEPAAGPPPASTSAEARPGQLEFRSPEAGFSLTYPSSWTRAVPADPQVRIVAHDGPYSFLVRVVELPAAPSDPAETRRLTDRIALSDESVRLLSEPQPVTLSGLPGYFYFYTFTDRGSGQVGAHSHFFLFRGSTMLVLVFQALPADTFRAGTATFDEITQSFRAG